MLCDVCFQPECPTRPRRATVPRDSLDETASPESATYRGYIDWAVHPRPKHSSSCIGDTQS